jgi:hypothetical protein
MPIGKPTHTVDSVLAKLRAMERGFFTRWLILALVGGVVCMIGPVIFGTLFWLRQYRDGVAIVEPRPWLIVVSMTAAWFLPILFLIEWLTRGSLLENTLEGASDMGFSYGGRMAGGSYFAGRAVAGAMIVEMCLWGPRMVIGGITRLFHRTAHARADRKLAARMLHAMIVKGEGLPTAQLYPLASDADAFSETLAYLIFFDLIGLSKKGDRAWILGEAKRTLGIEP